MQTFEIRWTQVFVTIGAGLFVVALTSSAILIPSLVALHVLQALIYVAVVVLTKRNSAWGYGAGLVVATAWNCLSIFITHLFQVGIGQLYAVVRGGGLSRPDSLTVMIGGIGHFIMIVACAIGFLRLRPGKRAWLQFAAGGLLVLTYMAVIILVAAPKR